MKTIGVDIFLNTSKVPTENSPRLPEKLGGFDLQVISNRGTKVWPGKKPDIVMVDSYCCRFAKNGWSEVTQEEIMGLLKAVGDLGLNWVHIEKLHEIKGVKAFSSVQGE